MWFLNLINFKDFLSHINIWKIAEVVILAAVVFSLMIKIQQPTTKIIAQPGSHITTGTEVDKNKYHSIGCNMGIVRGALSWGW